MINIALCGAGGMGTVHYMNYKHIQNCKVAAICDNSPAAKEKAKEWGIPCYDDLETLLSGEQIDAVDVCTPTFMHKPFVMTALRSGKSCICEKPLALSSAEAKEMYATAKENGVNLYVGQIVRFMPESVVLRGLINSGEYGKVMSADFLRLSACPRWAVGGWLFDKAKSGHIPYDLHIHDLDFIVSLFGKPVMSSFTGRGRQGISYREHYRFIYEFAGGESIECQAAWYNADIPFNASWRVCFENAVVENSEHGVFAYSFDNPPVKFDTEEKVKIPTGINIPPTGVFLTELSHFVDCIEKGIESSIIKEDEIITVMEILENVNMEDENE